MHPEHTDDTLQVTCWDEGTEPKTTCCNSVGTYCSEEVEAKPASTRRKRRTLIVTNPVAVIEWILGKFPVEELKKKPPFIIFRVREFFASQSIVGNLQVLVDLINRGVLYFHQSPKNLVLAVSYDAYDKVGEDCLRLVGLRKLLGPALKELLEDCPDAIHVAD
jgi:hypothetical protein